MNELGPEGHRDIHGGDPVCWLHRLCPNCGAMPAADEPRQVLALRRATDRPGHSGMSAGIRWSGS